MNTTLQITVRNHPGVMSHICGLFARRVFNVEAIFCLPIGDGTRSLIWLRVPEDARLDQMLKQLERLIDVEEVRRYDTGSNVFQNLKKFFEEASLSVPPAAS